MGKTVTDYPVHQKHTEWEIKLPPKSKVSLDTLIAISQVNNIPADAEVSIVRNWREHEIAPVVVKFSKVE